MGTLADLNRAQTLFDLGHRHLAQFGVRLAAQIGAQIDPEKLTYVVTNRRLQERYRRWLIGEKGQRCPLDADTVGLKTVADRLFSMHTEFVRSLRRIITDGDQLPIQSACNASLEWVRPRMAEESNPWSVLGNSFFCPFSQARDVDDALYIAFWSRGAGREKPEWLFGNLPRLRDQLADWREWFAGVRARLQGRMPLVDFPLSIRQKKILKNLEGRALPTDLLAKAVGCNRTTLFDPGGVNELIERGLVLNDQKVGGYYRPDAPPAD